VIPVTEARLCQHLDLDLVDLKLLCHQISNRVSRRVEEVKDVEEEEGEGEIDCPPYEHGRRGPRSSGTCLSDPPGRDEAVVWEGTQK